jgi:hypothetical protein
MQILIILWEPNDAWKALGSDAQKQYLLSLDDAINAARSQGLATLGWSRIDRSLPKAPAEGYVGVFGVTTQQQVHQLDAAIQASQWYEYFDSVNVSINPQGGTNPTPSREYATLLDIALDPP